jgi:phosphohistidine swiveling domain-containing protein
MRTPDPTIKKLSLQEWRARPKATSPVYPSVYTMAYATGTACLKMYSAKLRAVIAVLDDANIEIVLNSKEDYKKFGDILLKKFQQSPRYLDTLITWSEKNSNILFNYLQKNLNSTLLPSLTNAQIAERYSAYIALYLHYHLHNTPPWWIGAPAAEEALKNFLLAKNIKNTDAVISTIIDPLEYQTENTQEELSLLDIAIQLQKKRIHAINKIGDLPHTVQLNLKKHSQMFSSIPFGYNTGVIWDEQYFFKKLKTLLARNPAAEKNKLLRSKKNKRTKRDSITSQLQLPANIQKLVVAIRKLSYLQELKKSAQTRSHPLLQTAVIPEIARRLGLTPGLLHYMDKVEIRRCLLKNAVSAAFKKELTQRIGCSVHIIRNMKSKWLLGNEAQQFVKINNLNIATADTQKINGTTASKGFAKGTVKICRLSTEISKVNKGDILVTAMTTPDFVPAMRKSGAIITDEGGLTSHAAIISRELNIPCIIGTKIATKVLKDGDVVEVDANKGIVRIIKKSKR